MLARRRRIRSRGGGRIAHARLFQCTALGFDTVRVLRNDALELTLNIAEGANGGIRLTGIRDVAANRQWLSEPSPLFELSANGATWLSDGGLIIDSVQQAGGDLKVTARTRELGFLIELQISLPIGSGTAVVRGSIRNPGKDWFGPFLAGDRERGPIPIFPSDAELAVVRCTVSEEELLVSGIDGILYATEERNDGPWTAPRPLWSTSNPRWRGFFPPGAPLAAVRRNDHQRDVFAIGGDGHLYTVFRLDENWWSEPTRLSHASAAPFVGGGSVAALSVHEQTDPPAGLGPRRNEVDVRHFQSVRPGARFARD